MKKLVYFCLITLALILLPLTACQAEGETSSVVSLLESNTKAVIESADDIVFTPGGYAYRANFHQQGVENPWTPIETANIEFKNNDETAYARYRDYIVTETGSTRNNIVNIMTPGNIEIGEVNPIITNENAGIEVVQGDRRSGPATRSIVLEITALPDAQPGEYTFEIGVEIEGTEYGVLPCTIYLVEGTFNILSLTSA